jgi:hypothetical protein
MLKRGFSAEWIPLVFPIQTNMANLRAAFQIEIFFCFIFEDRHRIALQMAINVHPKNGAMLMLENSYLWT